MPQAKEKEDITVCPKSHGSKRSHIEFYLANLSYDLGLRKPIIDYVPNLRDQVLRAYLQKGTC